MFDCRWEKLGPSVIEKGYRIGCSSDFWNRYEEDIGIAKDLGEHTQPLACVQTAAANSSTDTQLPTWQSASCTLADRAA